MSKTIDERVVSLEFDNKRFEQNVSTTMSTLDKLKKSLNLSGASKGLENLDSAAKKVNMSGLGNAVDSVRMKFSALDVVGVTALTNITNSVLNASKRMASALTIDPIKTGFQEYETQMNSVQTILANTESKGSTLKDVNQALDELNKYADQTIYNFTEMTRNIGTFTAAGVELDTSVNAIKGIANLAAVSGSTSQQASTAMYQLSQALASGTVKLMDWNSVVNAGMGGQVFQDALKETARVHGVAIDSMIEEQGSFRETLSEGWLTSEILTDTLQKFTLTTEGLTEEQIKANREMLKAKGYTDEQIDGIFKLGNTATNAATKVKTFTQLWDVMKESAQSGWAQTWKLLVGDFEQAKNLLTPLSEFFTGFIGRMSDARNKLLEGALGKSVTEAFDKVSDAFKVLDKVMDGAKEGIDAVVKPIEKVTDSLEDLETIVDDVIGGKFGNGEERFKALTEAGHNYYRVQNKVNETLGNSFRHSKEKIEAQDKLLGKQKETTKETEKEAESTKKLTGEQKERLKLLGSMTEEQMEANGYTKEQIQAIKELGEVANKLGIPFDEFIDNLDEINGRWLMINSFKNIGQGIVAVFKALGEAWKEIFPPMTSDQLFNIIAGMHKLTSYLKVNDEAADKFKRTFKGVFAALDIVLTIIGGPIKIAFKALTQLLGMFDLNILDVTASVGDAIVKFHDWLDSVLDFTKVFEKIVPVCKNAWKAIKEWFNGLKNAENLPKAIADSIIKGLGKAVTFAKELIGKLVDIIQNGLDGAPGDLLSGFANGIREGISVAGKVMLEFGKAILEKFREVLGIHSPSTETKSDGKNFVMGFVNGIKEFATLAWNTIKDFGGKAIEFLRNLDWGAIFAGIVSVVMLTTLIKIGKVISALASPLENLGDVLEATADVVKQSAKVVKNFGKVLGSISKLILAKALKELAIALLILVGAIVLLALVDWKKLLIATGVLIALMGAISGMMFAITKLGKDAEVKIAKFALLFLSIAGAMAALVIVAKVLAGMSWEEFGKAAAGLTGLVAIMALLMGVAKITDAKKIGGMLAQMAIAMGLLVVIAKVLAGMTWNEMGRAAVGMIGLVGVVAALSILSNIIDVRAVGKTLLQLALAMGILAITVKLLGGITWDEMGHAAVGLGGLMACLTILVKITKLGKVKKVGKILIQMATAMAILALVSRLLAGMSWDQMAHAAVGLAGLVGVIALLTSITKLAGEKELKRLGSTLMMMSISMGILAGVSILLSLMSYEGLAKGLTAVGLLAAMMSMMVAATRGAQDCKGNLIVMTVAIVAMTAAVAALALIDGDKLAYATTALTMLMLAFATIIHASGFAQKAVGTLIVMSLAVGVLAGVLWGVTLLPGDKAITAATALSILLVSMSAAMFILSQMSTTAGKALIGIALLTAMSVPLFAFAYALSIMPDVKHAWANAIVLAGLATAMTALLIPLSLIGSFGAAPLLGVLALTAMTVPLLTFAYALSIMPDLDKAWTNTILLTGLAAAMTALLIPLTVIGAFAIAALAGVLALTTMAIPLLAFVGVLALMQNIQNAEANTKSLIALMVTMTAVLVAVSAVAPLAMAGVGALTALTALMVGIGALAVSIGYLMDKYPKLEEFLNVGLPILNRLAYGVGELVGNLVAGFATSVAASLPGIGTQLTAFMDEVSGFVEGSKKINGDVLIGVGTLAAAIALLTAVDFMTGVSSFLQGGSSLSSLGTELSDFMDEASSFIEAASLVKPSMIEGVKTLSETILILTAADILNGLTSWLTGGASLSTFGAQLPQLGKDMASFASNLGTFDGAKLESVKVACDAIKTLAQAADTLPNEGGWAGAIFGENGLGAFAEQLPDTATALNGFITNLGTFDSAKLETVNVACDAIAALANVASDLPNDGGWAGKIFGENGIAAFADQLPGTATALNSFISNLGSFDQSKVDTVNLVAGAIGSLADMASKIPNEDGFWSKLFGDNSISTFAEKLPVLGEKFAEFTTKAASVDPDATGKVTRVINSIVRITNVGKDSATTMSTFGTNLSKFGNNIKAFSDKVSKIDASKLNSSIDNLKKISEFAKNFSTTGAEAFNKFSESLKTVATDGVKKFADKLSDNAALTKAKKSAEKLLDAYVKKIKDKIPDAEDAAEKVSTEAADAAKSKTAYNDFKSAGKYVVEGFAEGISANQYKATAKARAMAAAAAKAAKEELKEHSPSKVFYGIGDYAGVAFVNALGDYVGEAGKAGSTLAGSSIDGLKNAMALVNDIVNSDVSAQPTIRPVLDLSSVKSGANSIGSMLNGKRTISVDTRYIDAVAASMGGRQNEGGNDDIVKALKDLRKDLADTPRNNYNINGLSYGDDNAVTNAIVALITALKLEGRA